MFFYTTGKYQLPKGTVVWPNLFALHHDPAHWSDPYKFHPERFLDEDGCFSGFPPSFKPFGTGKRVCIGENLAKAELQVSTQK